MTSRSCRRRPILGLARSPSWMPGSLGHPRGAGRRVRARAAWVGGQAPVSPRVAEAPGSALPGPPGSRSPLPGRVRPPLSDSARPAAASPPPGARLAPAASPAVRAASRLGSPPLRLGVPSPPVPPPRLAPLLPPSPRLLCPLSFPEPAPRALAALTPFSPSPGLRQSAGRAGSAGGRRSPGRSWGVGGRGRERRQLPASRRISGWGLGSPRESEGTWGAQVNL